MHGGGKVNEMYMAPVVEEGFKGTVRGGGHKMQLGAYGKND